MDGADGVTFGECGRCRRQFVRDADAPSAYSVDGVAALIGGTVAEWQFIGPWSQDRSADLFGLDHYRRQPPAAGSRR
jgi:hypothetical protein